MGITYFPPPPPEHPPGPQLGEGSYPAQFTKFYLVTPAGGPSEPPYWNYPANAIRDSFSASYEVKPVSALQNSNVVDVALHLKLSFHVDIHTADAYSDNMDTFLNQRYMKDVSFIIRTRAGRGGRHTHKGIWAIDGVTVTDNGNQTSVVQCSCSIFGAYDPETRNMSPTP